MYMASLKVTYYKQVVCVYIYIRALKWLMKEHSVQSVSVPSVRLVLNSDRHNLCQSQRGIVQFITWFTFMPRMHCITKHVGTNQR